MQTKKGKTSNVGQKRKSMINNDNKKKNRKATGIINTKHSNCVRSAYAHTQKHEHERLFLTLNTPKLDVTTRIEEKKEQKKKENQQHIKTMELVLQ